MSIEELIAPEKSCRTTKTECCVITKIEHSIGGVKEISCIRPEHHEGPHVGKNMFGDFVSWGEERKRLSDQKGGWLSNAITEERPPSVEEWIKLGLEYYNQLPKRVRQKHTGCYFYCNVRDGSYVIARTHNEAGSKYRAKYFLPSEGLTIYGKIIDV